MTSHAEAENKEDNSAKGITRITVSGFKSLAEECSVEIRPLTILAGANSSGKTSIMQPLLLMKQTLEATYDPGPLLLDGPHVHFNLAEQMFARLIDGTAVQDFRVGIEVADFGTLTDTFRKLPEGGVELTQITFVVGRAATTLRPGMAHSQIVNGLAEWMDDVRTRLSRAGEEHAVELEWRVGRDRCFLVLDLYAPGMENWPLALPAVWGPASDLVSCVRETIHLPGLRGNPERAYKATAVGPEFPGTFQNYVASVVHHWQETGAQQHTRVQEAMGGLGLTSMVKAKRLDDTRTEILVGRLPPSGGDGEEDMVNIADVGFGVSQVLPVLVALLVAEPGQLVYLEQPELHLHPRAQVALAHVLADAANRGVRVVAETHSQLLLLGVQTLVAEGKIAPDKVILHWFKRREEDGVTEVTSAELDEAGRFGEEWPEDFADVTLSAQGRFLDAVEDRLMVR